jgi:hypothetical protein
VIGVEQERRVAAGLLERLDRGHRRVLMIEVRVQPGMRHDDDVRLYFAKDVSEIVDQMIPGVRARTD